MSGGAQTAEQIDVQTDPYMARLVEARAKELGSIKEKYPINDNGEPDVEKFTDEQSETFMADYGKLTAIEKKIKERKAALSVASFDEDEEGDLEIKDADHDRKVSKFLLDKQTIALVHRASQEKGISLDEAASELTKEKNLFMTYMRGGAQELAKRDMQEDFKNLITTAESANAGFGGYNVPAMVEAALVVIMEYYGPMAQVSNVMTVNHMRLINVSKTDDTAQEGERLEEGADATDEDPGFTKVPLKPDRWSSKIIKVSREWLMSTAIDQAENELIMLAGVRLGRGQNRAFTSAVAGVPKASFMTVGAVTGAKVGKVGVATQTGTVVPKDLTALQHSVDIAYQTDASWQFSQATLVELMDMTIGGGDGRPLIMPSYREGMGMTLLGKPIHPNNHMDSFGASKKPIMYGDYRQYRVHRVNGGGGEMWMSRFAEEEKYAKAGMVGFLCQRWDAGNVIVDDAIKVFQNPAA